jgi:uncharacterized membrane protein YedE/YeeE
MAVALITRVPVDRINEQVKQVRFWRTVATVLAGLLWGIGWLAAKCCALTWLALAWAVAAVRVGWADARRPTGERGAG